MKMIAAALLALFQCSAALAADPTRPPDNWLATASGDGQPAVDTGPRLQSVLIPQAGRPLAVIGGQTVPLGGRYGELRLIRLNEREAVLQGADGITRLYLTPEVEKQPVVSRKPRSPAKAGKAKDLP